jgi:hypothetical protein
LRPEIANLVRKLSKFASKPVIGHVSAMEREMKYCVAEKGIGWILKPFETWSANDNSSYPLDLDNIFLFCFTQKILNISVSCPSSNIPAFNKINSTFVLLSQYHRHFTFVPIDSIAFLTYNIS